MSRRLRRSRQAPKGCRRRRKLRAFARAGGCRIAYQNKVVRGPDGEPKVTSTVVLIATQILKGGG